MAASPKSWQQWETWHAPPSTSRPRCAASGAGNCRIPAVIGNAGSFFKNPIVATATAAELKTRHPALPVFPGADPATRKLSAAWLIEQAGWRGFRDGDAGVAAQHALVLVNHGQATGAQLLALARRIAVSAVERYGISLEPEPRIIGATFRA